MPNLMAVALASVLVAAVSVAPVLAQPPPQHQAKTQAPPRSKPDFANTKISELVKDPKAKAIMEKYLPELSDHYEQIGDMTLTEASVGSLDEPLIKKMQADYDEG